jgi:hypothetical protein
MLLTLVGPAFENLSILLENERIRLGHHFALAIP